MTRLPSSGSELLAKTREIRRRVASGAANVRLTHANIYVGVRAGPMPPREAYPVGYAWNDLYLSGRREAGKMALEACRIAGRKITSPHKANEAVKDELRALGILNRWQVAKVKGGRPSKPRTRS